MDKSADENAGLRADLPGNERCPALRGLLPANGQSQGSAVDQPDAKENDGLIRVSGCGLRFRLSPLPVSPFAGQENRTRPFSKSYGLNRPNWLNGQT